MPTAGLEPMPPLPYVFSYPMLYHLSHSGLHICNCLELLLIPELYNSYYYSISFLVFLQMAASCIPFGSPVDLFHPMPLNRVAFKYTQHSIQRHRESSFCPSTVDLLYWKYLIILMIF